MDVFCCLNDRQWFIYAFDLSKLIVSGTLQPVSMLPNNTITHLYKDAMQFPLLGSASLFSLYMAFKFFDRSVVNMIISVYFGLVGCAALTVTFSPILGAMLPKVFANKRLQKEIKINHFLPQSIGGESPWDFSIDASLADLLAFVASVAFSVVYLKSKHWALNNVLGIAFCLQGIERFSLGTYKIGAILLVGLFFYDIFWVRAVATLNVLLKVQGVNATFLG